MENSLSRSDPTAASIPRASLWECLRFNFLIILPLALQGLYIRSPFWVGWLSRHHPDPLGLRFCQVLRARHGDYVRLRLLFSPCVLVLDPAGIRRVLDNSPAIYAEPASKRRGMSHFQPGALTISRGALWTRRRRFNVAVLGGAQAGTLPLVGQAVARCLARNPRQLDWSAISGLMEDIALQTVLGPGVRDLQQGDRLAAMMREANRGKRRQSRHFNAFYQGIGNALRFPVAGGLVARATGVGADADTRVENQIPHWLFALKDTLAENLARALALLAARRDLVEPLRAEFRGADLDDPAVIDGLQLTRGLVQEAMRLWPSTPMLVREALVADVLGPGLIPAGIQVVILNGFNHRDPAGVSDPHQAVPERWRTGAVDYRFNHLSNGGQSCPGAALALFIATAVLAHLLSNGDYRLEEPSLSKEGPLPESLDFFRLKVNREG